MSSELEAEFDEAFVCLSNTGDSKGFIKGSDVKKICETLGLVLTSTLNKFYSDNANEKVYIDTFRKVSRNCLTNNHDFMDSEIEQVYDYFRGEASDAPALDAYELTGWLTKIGEPVHHEEVERQLSNFTSGDHDSGKSIPLLAFLTMVKKQNGDIVINEG